MTKITIPEEATSVALGDRAESVEPAQEYLRRFGYLESGQENSFTVDDVFVRSEGENDHLPDAIPSAEAGTLDNATSDALVRFQAFLGLEQTGVIDAATREAMNTPRCGNPDPQIDEFTTGVGKWDKTNLTYSFQNYTTGISNDAARWAIDQAFALWSAETPLRFRRVADGTAGDIIIRFVTGDHGDGYAFNDGRGGVLAHAFFPSNGNPIRGDAHFDKAEIWTVSVPSGSMADLVTIAAHEFGHSLGLRHSSDRAALMFPTYRGAQRKLGNDDIAGVQSLYGGPGALENATWVHGNAAVIEYPIYVESQRYYGFFNRVVGRANTRNWIHLSLPTPVIEDRRRLSYDRFMLRAATGRNTVLRDVHIRDGERLIARHNFVNRSGGLWFERFGVASMPPVRWGTSISLGFDFGAGSSYDRRVDLISAGMDYK